MPCVRSVLVRARPSFRPQLCGSRCPAFACACMCVSRQDPITSSTTMAVSVRLVGTRHSAAVWYITLGNKKKITSFPSRVIIILSPENK